MTKIDYKKELKHLYRPSAKKVVELDIPDMQFLMIDGMGEPDPSCINEFSLALEALYPVAYTLKFMVKREELGVDYGVPPLEGLWWADDMSDFEKGNKSTWKWTLMIMQPEFISPQMVTQAMAQVKQKKNPQALGKLRFETYKEGRCAQIMHIGPFSEEGPTVKKVHDFIESSSCELSGKHHEIYLSDIRRAAPEKWKTVIRQGMA